MLQPLCTTVATPTGDLAVIDHPSDGPDILCLHGVGYSADMWEELAQALHGKARVVSLDLRGHGQSEAELTEAEQIWRDLPIVIEALGLTEPVLVGHDFGGYFAAAAAATWPELASGLVIIDGPVSLPRDEAVEWLATITGPEVVDILAERFGLGVGGNDQTDFEEFFDKSVARVVEDWMTHETGIDHVRSGLTRSIRRSGDGSWQRRPDPEVIRILGQVSSEADVFYSIDIYDRLSLPILFVQPSDGLYADAAESIRTLVQGHPERTLIECPGGSHIAQTDPEAIALDIVNFLQRRDELSGGN
ncbi:alpha/beta fold hydrolase [Gephyromycinifex aptenodytis]|uniref:alpha/beta fold hydrolase n=1 Tax=Gephyromycinifex aptenodytis TaxID=2716227 RepID=UPI001447F4E8|nr:alpha/beta hydrolase [Gephyromycinifex aptenodytis]